MKRHLSTLGLAICAATCGLAGHAQASRNAGPAFADVGLAAARDGGLSTVEVQTVGDDVLAGQTGKYAGGTMISGFVLNIISQWQLPNGVAALAQGTLTATQNAVGQVATTVSTLASVTGGGVNAATAPAATPGANPGPKPTTNPTTNPNPSSSPGSGANPSALASGGQSLSVNGVSQITQVAGDRNTGSNSALIDFNSGAPMTLASTANAPSATASNTTGSVKAGITFGSNGVNVALQTPAGLATQTITPGNGQIAQLLQIAGKNQQVANALQLNLQTQQMSAAMIRQLGVLQALQNRR